MTEKIIINLNHSREACSLKEEDEIIQKEALRQFKTLLKETKKRIGGFKEQLNSNTHERMRTHDVITIDGKRGSGKTTFILSAWKTLEKHEKKDICFLGILDPTLIETREHIFITIISLIKNKVDSYYRNSDNNKEYEFNQWRISLQKLATGLTLLNGVGTNPMEKESWVDEQLALECGLKQVQGGNNLELSFHKFVNKSLSFIEKKAFFLAFDDIDTDFSKGWPVLEILRKYLTTPQLITVLSGDLRLYSTLVQKKQFENIGLTFKDSLENRTPFQGMVDELVDQYLLKIMRTSHRIELKSIAHYYNKYENNFLIQFGEDEKTLHDFISNYICTNILFIPQSLTEETRQIFLHLEPRTLINILTSIYPLIIQRKGIPEVHDTSTPQNIASIQSLGDVFIYWLNRLGFRRQDLEETIPLEAIKKTTSILTQKNILPNAASFRPRLTDTGHNKALCIVGGFLANLMRKDPASYFDYMLRVSLTSNVFEELPDIPYSYNKISGSDPYRKRIIRSNISPRERYTKHVGISEENNCKDLTSRYISFMYPQSFTSKNMSRPKVVRGTTQLYSENTLPQCTGSDAFGAIPDVSAYGTSKLKINSPEDLAKHPQQFNTIPTLNKCVDTWHKALIPLLISKNIRHDVTYRYLSFFTLLGSICQLLRSESKNDLKTCFKKLALIKEFPVEADLHENIDIEDSEIEDEIDISISNNLIEEFLKWKKNISPEMNVHPVLITKATTRFYHSITSSPNSSDSLLAGEIIHRQIILFLNALLVEEASLRSLNQQPKQNSPISKDSIFIHNLSLFEVVKGYNFKEMPFFEWIIQCPIWKYFLDYSANDKNTTDKILKAMKAPLTFSENFWCKYNGPNTTHVVTLCDALNTLALIGMPKPKTFQIPNTKKKSSYAELRKYIETHEGYVLSLWNEHYTEKTSENLFSFAQLLTKEINRNSTYKFPVAKTKKSKAYLKYIFGILNFITSK